MNLCLIFMPPIMQPMLVLPSPSLADGSAIFVLVVCLIAKNNPHLRLLHSRRRPDGQTWHWPTVRIGSCEGQQCYTYQPYMMIAFTAYTNGADAATTLR